MRRLPAYVAGPGWATDRRVLRPRTPRRRDEAGLRRAGGDPFLDQLNRAGREAAELERHRIALGDPEVAAKLVQDEAVRRIAGIDAKLTGGVRGEVRGGDADQVRVRFARRQRHVVRVLPHVVAG